MLLLSAAVATTSLASPTRTVEEVAALEQRLEALVADPEESMP